MREHHEEMTTDRRVPPQVSDDTLDLLADLQHDLGKYLRMPLGFLPADASDDEVRAAAHKALFQTRVTPAGTRTARMLWQRFLDEGGAALRAADGFDDLEHAVMAALGWEPAVRDGAAPLERPALEADFSAVGAAIRVLVQQLRDGAA